MPTTFGNRSGAAVILMDDDCDWTLWLPPTSGVWPSGTEAWIRFYNSDDSVLLELSAGYFPDMLTFSLQADATPLAPKDIPDGTRYKIRVSLPTEPNTTEAPLWRGTVEKEV